MDNEITLRTPSDLVRELIQLLTNFQSLPAAADLRKKVQALVPAYERLSELGISLIPARIASSARERLLHYFLEYPFTPIPRQELRVVAGIDDWARRVRELRVEFGWPIITGATARQMVEEEDFPLENLDVSELGPDDYVLLGVEQDREAAYRWRVAKEIRNSGGSVRDRILAFLRKNVGRQVTGEELRYVAQNATEWARRVRELRTEYGWPVVTKSSGRPDLPIGAYVLEQDRQSPEHDRRIPDKVRGQVLRRDEYTCRKCGWNHSMFNRSDPRHLELHHIRAHAKGGSHTRDNLITLCTVCHDDWHASRLPDDDFFDWLQQL